MKFRDVIAILRTNGFELVRQDGSHRIYQRVTESETRIVPVAYHRLSEDVKRGTLGSIIRRSGLPKKLFR